MDHFWRSLPQFIVGDFTLTGLCSHFRVGQFAPPAIWLSWGDFSCYRSYSIQTPQKTLPFILLYLFLAYSVFAILYATDDSITYLLTPFLVFTLWIAFAIAIILPLTWKRFPLGYGLLSIYLLIFIFTIPRPSRKLIRATKHSQRTTLNIYSPSCLKTPSCLPVPIPIPFPSGTIILDWVCARICA